MGGLATVELSKAAVRSAIDQTINKQDEDLSTYLQHQMVVPKLCLTMAVMDQLNIAKLTYQPACGSCAGLLVHDHFWGGINAEPGDLYWPWGDASATSMATTATMPESRV